MIGPSGTGPIKGSGESPSPYNRRMIWKFSGRAGAAVGLAICLTAFQAWGQQPPATEQPSARPVESPAIPQTAGLPTPAAYPLELFGLLARPAALRGPLTLTPSIAVSEEYNDNIFQDNKRREYDFITTFTPSLMLVVNRPSYQASAGYSFGADIYARESQFDNALDRQNFVASGLYRAAPGLTLTGSDAFALNRNTDLTALQSSSVGRQESWSNTVSAGAAWQVTARNDLTLGASYSVLRFLGTGASTNTGTSGGTSRSTGVDSDTYGFQSSFGHAFTPRLHGTVGYNFTYINLTQNQEDSKTHSPSVGLSYQFTPTLTGAVSGGPAITEAGSKTFISPSGSTSLTQVLQFGSVGVQYNRAVSVAGGFGGTNDTQTASATLTVTTLRPGLVAVFSPAYIESSSVDNRQGSTQVDVKTVTLSLGVTYQVARFTTLFAGYSFLHQRTGSVAAAQHDVDQNRVRFGLQFGYPINFD